MSMPAAAVAAQSLPGADNFANHIGASDGQRRGIDRAPAENRKFRVSYALRAAAISLKGDSRVFAL
jgi:hypothetical protein